MQKRPFREHHLLAIFDGYDRQRLPLDLFLCQYFRSHKALGSKDRAWIAETLYGIVRWRGLIDYLCTEPATWEMRLEVFHRMSLKEYKGDTAAPLHIQVSFPKILFDLIARNYGEQRACELCRLSNEPAPTTVRINPLKTTREDMLERWKDCYEVSPCLQAPFGITFHKKMNFFSLPEFKQGLFEVQDEGSQLVATLVNAQPGQQVLDYCSGSGGKTLAFAPMMQNKGQIFLHDVRSHALMECRKRLRRAGIQNAQIVQGDEPKLKKLKKKMDWVLADVPCTGTGTLRRNPDMKWKFEQATLQRLVGQQRQIFEKALSFLKPDGKIVYATCSILKQENQEQIEHFRKTYGLRLEAEPFQSFPSHKGMDGFYAAVLSF